MPHKADGGKVNHRLRMGGLYLGLQPGTVGQIGLKWNHVMASRQGGGPKVTAGEAIGPRQQDTHQKEKPLWLRRRSASIIWHSCSSVVLGAQPSLALARAGLPMSSSTSAGL